MDEKKPKKVTWRMEEMRWIDDNEADLEEKYPGMWIAVQGRELVGVGKDIAEARAQAREKGIQKPFFHGLRRAEFRKLPFIG